MNLEPSISVIIPAFNEEKNIEKIILETVKALNGWASDFEVIVVDDGSRDNTRVLAQLLEQKGLIRVICHAINLGPGKAILTGFSQAKGEFLTYVAADGQFRPEELKNFFPAMEYSDIVVAYRSSRFDYSAYRLINSSVYLFMIRLLFGLKLKDVNWVHMYKRKVLDNIKVDSSGVFMLGEILVKAKKNGLRITQVETSYYPRREGKSKGSHPKAALLALLEILKLWLKLNLQPESK